MGFLVFSVSSYFLARHHFLFPCSFYLLVFERFFRFLIKKKGCKMSTELKAMIIGLSLAVPTIVLGFAIVFFISFYTAMGLLDIVRMLS